MQTPLHCAADSGNLIVVKYLVQQGANVNELDSSYYDCFIQQQLFILHQKEAI